MRNSPRSPEGTALWHFAQRAETQWLGIPGIGQHRELIDAISSRGRSPSTYGREGDICFALPETRDPLGVLIRPVISRR